MRKPSAKRRIITGALFIGILILASWTTPARAQVWIDATQLGDRLPDWVDSVYRIVSRRIWHEPVYQTVCDRIWVEGHYIVSTDVSHDPCNDPTIRYLHMPAQVWVPGH